MLSFKKMNKLLLGSIVLFLLIGCKQSVPTNSAITSPMNENKNLGIFENQTNVGHPEISGSVYYNDDNQEYTLKGSGINMWANNDQFQFLYKSIQGDFIVRSRMKFIGEGVDPHR